MIAMKWTFVSMSMNIFHFSLNFAFHLEVVFLLTQVEYGMNNVLIALHTKNVKK